ncbi:MAG: ABC transporter ATP-binding protein [Acidobacteriota bacterium]
MLQAQGLYFNYQRPVIEDVSLRLTAGEMLAVIGPNGSGKSTLVRLLAGLLTPAAGTVLFNEQLLTMWPRRELARQIAYVAQESRVQFPLVVFEFVLQGRFAHGRGLGFESEDDLAAAREALVLTHTAEFADRQLNALSGGERQRVFLARALAQQPKLLLLDEPTSNLDISHQVATLTLLTRLTRERGLAVLLITHELNLAAEFANRIMLLKAGRVAGCGSPSEVFQRELLEEVFETSLMVDRNPISGAPRVNVIATATGF